MGIYTDEEQVVRKNWLRASIANYVISPFVWLLIVLSWTSFMNLNDNGFAEFIGLCCGLLFTFFVLVRCAYSKPGNKYLIVSMFGNAVGAFSLVKFMFASDTPGFFALMSFAELGLLGWWFLASKNLLKANEAITDRIKKILSRKKVTKKRISKE